MRRNLGFSKKNHNGLFQLMGTINQLLQDYNFGRALERECKISDLWTNTGVHCFVLLFNNLFPSTSLNTAVRGEYQISIILINCQA